jgi:uncharacterized DUF497 family protein
VQDRGKPLVLTRHAEMKLHERGLERSWVERTVRDPQWTEPDARDSSAELRFRAIEDRDGRVLRVVCVETDAVIRIITAMINRGAKDPR